MVKKFISIMLSLCCICIAMTPASLVFASEAQENTAHTFTTPYFDSSSLSDWNIVETSTLDEATSTDNVVLVNHYNHYMVRDDEGNLVEKPAYSLMPSNGQNNFWFKVGGNVPADSEITSISIKVDIPWFMSVYASESRYGEYDLLTSTESTTIASDGLTEGGFQSGKSHQTTTMLTYGNLAGNAYRYFKVVMNSNYYANANVGDYSYTYDKTSLNKIPSNGSFVTDNTQNNTTAWNILDSYCVTRDDQGNVTSNGNMSFVNWDSLTDGVNYSVLPGDTNYYWLITGGIPEGSTITSFSMNTKMNCSSCFKVSGSKTLDGDYEEITKSSSDVLDPDYENIYTGNDDLKYTATYKITGNEGYRYIKIETNGNQFYGNYGIGEWQYTWKEIETNGSFVTDNRQNNTTAWNILDSYCVTRDDQGNVTSNGNMSFANWPSLTDGVNYSVLPDATNYYWLITGGIPEGSTITSFSMNTKMNCSSCFKVYGSKTLDGDYKEITKSSSDVLDPDYENIYTGNDALKYTATYKITGNEGYRYIKIETNGNQFYGNYGIGEWQYTWKEIETRGTTTVDYVNMSDCTFSGFNKHSNDTACYVDKGATTKYNGGYFFEGTSGINSLVVTVPENIEISKLIVDYLWLSNESCIKVYVSSTGNDADYTEITGTFGQNVILYSDTSTEEAPANSYYNVYTPCTFTDIPAGTRYIKLQNDDSSYPHCLGAIKYDWNKPNTATCEYDPDVAKITAKISVSAYSADFAPVIVFAGYNGDKLEKCEVVHNYTISGNEDIVLELDTTGITRARVYVWDASGLSPIVDIPEVGLN